MKISQQPRFFAFGQTLVNAILLFLGVVLTGCGTTMHLPSHWPEKSIAIDGKNTEWDRTYLIDDNKLIISFVNDSNFVYLLLATNDRQLAMSMMRGLTVWFDAHGGNDQTFGIHYPMGGMFARAGRSAGTGNDEPSLEPTEQYSLTPSELEILGPGKKDRHRMQIMETGGIEAKYTSSVNSFIYEMKVPFAEGDQYPFAIHSKLGNIVGLGLETSQERSQKGEEENNRRRDESDASEGKDESGYEGGGMRGGGRGGFGQAGARGSSAPLDIWMKVKLVAKDTLSN